MLGFTGKRIAFEIAKNPPKTTGNSQLKWAIAGRDAAKLHSVLELIMSSSQDICPKPEIVVVDVSQTELLQATIAKYRVCINCVGPFRLYGGPGNYLLEPIETALCRSFLLLSNLTMNH